MLVPPLLVRLAHRPFTAVALLVDERGNTHKIYPSVPEPAILRADSSLLGVSLRGKEERQKMSLPFAGRYYTQPLPTLLPVGSCFFLGWISRAGAPVSVGSHAYHA